MSGPLYVVLVHPEMPDVASDPLKAMFTGWLNQPFASVPRSAEAVTLGGVASRRTVTVVVSSTPLEFDHVHETEAPARVVRDRRRAAAAGASRPRAATPS